MADPSRYIEYIDKYCERVSPGMWGEPLNIISNVAFLLAALLLLKYFKKNYIGEYLKHWDIAVLITLLFFITIGSTLWHILAIRWALYTDVIPILVFVNLFFLSCFVRILNLSTIKVILFFSIYQLFSFVIKTQYPIHTLNGSIFYLPILISLAVITIVLYRQKSHLGQYYLTAFLIFTIALSLRTVDISQCEMFPAGTHFLWHIFISVMLYSLTMSLMDRNKIKYN